MIWKSIAVIALLMMPFSALAESSLCIAEKSVGYDWENNQWVPKIFRTESKYILRTATDEDRNKQSLGNPIGLAKTRISHVVSQFGHKSLFACWNNEISIVCDLFVGAFNLRKSSQKFSYVANLETLKLNQSEVQDFEKRFHPMSSAFIEIGSCSNI
jgi:hypothetical protein